MYLGMILAALLAIVLIEIAFGRFMQKEHTKLRDVFIEIFSTANVFFLTVPLTVAVAASLAAFMLPNHAGALSHLPAWIMFLMLMVGEDMLQYWWHRANHKFPILYNLHRVHHDADYLNIRITFRNNLFYYLPMPSIWSSAVLVYLGLGPVYAVYIVAKYLVIMGAHSSVHWDEPLYKIKWLSPVMWVVERVISTPATHSAHHGRHKEDGVTNYKGNFGNFFFLWDVIFSTAKITRKFPKEYGVENLNDISGAQLMFWPLVGASKGSQERVVKPAE